MKLFLLLLLFVAISSYATEFGRVKITGTDDEWWVIHSSHFDIYYEEGTEAVAESSVVIAERELNLLSETFDYLPSKPIPIIVYRSPARFRQTTLLPGDMGEGIGGFTEFYKGRIAVPYSGVWSDYRHVVAHELNHAFVFDMMYRRNLTNIVRSRAPLWVMEGLAEYTSLGWDTASEVEFRDMVINNSIVTVGELNRTQDYLVYREGQAIYHFMNVRYGEEKYLEFVRHMRDRNGIEGTFDVVFNMSVNQFSERFIEWARQSYWGEVGISDSPSDIGNPILQGEGNEASRINLAGAVISPDGSMVAGCEYYHARFSAVVRSAIDGEVIFRPIAGGGLFEEAVSPVVRTMAFSPRSDSVAVAFHKQVTDGIKISEIGGSPIDLPVEFELIRDPVWSPAGGQIAFSALQGDFLDIWLYTIATNELVQISKNEQGEIELWWGESGIWCISEEPSLNERSIQCWQTDGSMEEVYVSNEDISSPIETSRGVVFISSLLNEPNFYLLERDTDNLVKLTDLYTTPQFPSIADSSGIVLFQASDWSGSGLFTARNLYEDGEIVTEFDNQTNNQDEYVEPLVFNADIWRIAPYTPNLSLDDVSANAGFDSYSGLTGNSYFIFSDILAQNQLGVLANFSGQVTDMDIALSYSNLRNRWQSGGSVYRFASRYVFEDSTGYRDYVRDISIGGSLNSIYPITKALKTGISGYYRRVSREGLWSNDLFFRENIFSVRTNLVYDNALWGAVGPRVGSRMSVNFDYAPGFWDNAEYFTAMLDLRQYTWLSSDVTLAARLAGGISYGANRQRFFLGGSLPHRRSVGDVKGVGDFYQFYSSYADMLRGWDFVSLNGTRYGVASLEFRYPVLNYLSLAAPIPLTFTRGRGVLFTDLGFVTDDMSTFKGATTSQGGYRLQDIKMSFGTGFRLNVGFVVLMADIAWRTDLSSISQKPEYYFTMSTEF